MRHSAVVVAMVMGLGGCATVFSSGTQPVEIVGVPAGAQVSVDGGDVGAQRNLILKRGETHRVAVKQPGCPDSNVVVGTNLNGVAVWNLVNPVGWIVDAMTGSLWDLDDSVTVPACQPAAVSAR